MPSGVAPGQLFNDSLNHGGPWAAPGGTVVGKDGQKIREMVATVSLLGGDVVILDVSATSNYQVNTTSISDHPLRYGIVTGAQIGVQAAAASAPVWIVIEGPAWANGSSAISVGDLVGTTSLVRGHVWKSGVGGSQGRNIIALPATVSLAASFVSFTTTTINITVAGLLATDTPIAFTPNASIPANLVFGGVWSEGTTSAAVRIGNPTATAVASQASIPGILTVARGSSLGLAQTIIGPAMTSTGAAASTPVLVLVDKR